MLIVFPGHNKVILKRCGLRPPPRKKMETGLWVGEGTSVLTWEEVFFCNYYWHLCTCCFEFDLELIYTRERRLQLFSFWKTHNCKLISNWTRKTVWLLISNINMKNFARRKCRKIVLEAIFLHSRKLYSYRIFLIVLLDIIGLENFPLSFSQS